jgi:hypothetical protein
VTFNHGVLGSSPSGLTKEINGLSEHPERAASQKLPLGSAGEARGICLAAGAGRLIRGMEKVAMAKQMKKAKRPTPGVTIIINAPPAPSQEDFKRARDLLRRRADALILDLAGRYLLSKATELTTVLDAIDSLAELERTQRPSAA